MRIPKTSLTTCWDRPSRDRDRAGFQSSEIVPARLVNGQAADVSWTVGDTTIVNVTALDSRRRQSNALIVVTEQPPTKWTVRSLLYAYRDRARRDAAPRSGAADWAQAACGTQQQQVGMSRGETRTLSTIVAARDLLGPSLPAGRYYFALSVQAEGNRVFLSAGEADLSP